MTSYHICSREDLRPGPVGPAERQALAQHGHVPGDDRRQGVVLRLCYIKV